MGPFVSAVLPLGGSAFHRRIHQAESELRRLQTDVEYGRFTEPSRLTLGQFITQYLQDAEHRLKPTTLWHYRWIFEHQVIPALGGLRLQDLKAPVLDKFLQGRNTPDTAVKCRRYLHLVLAEAVRLDLLAVNPIERVRPPKAPRPKRGSWDAAQLARFLEIAEKDAYQPLWTLAVYTGMRRGELLGLRWHDVDLDAEALQIEQQITTVGTATITQTPKTERGKRTIQLRGQLLTVLREHYTQWSEQQQKREAKAGKFERFDSGLVCRARNGNPILPRNADRRFQELREAAGLPHISLHGLRHSAISNMLANGVPVHEASAMAGHCSPEVTMNVYAHVLSDRKSAATDTLASVIDQARKKTAS